MRNILVVTGGAGFIGSNLISELLKFKKFRILSIDNYSSGFIKNHIKNKRVKYLKGSTKNIENLLRNYIGKIHSIYLLTLSCFKFWILFINYVKFTSTSHNFAINISFF